MAPKRKPAVSPVETEAKIRVPSIAAIRRRLVAAGARKRSARALETNTLFDSADRSLLSQGKSFRVRRYGAEGLVTLKGAARVAGGLKSRSEVETEVASPEVMTEILNSLGFLSLFRYEKFREVWSLGGALICLDETPAGDFAEIEGTETSIRRVARKLALDSGAFLSASYPALWAASGGTGDMLFPATKRKARA
jgi:adenylate cyclase class 2